MHIHTVQTMFVIIIIFTVKEMLSTLEYGTKQDYTAGTAAFANAVIAAANVTAVDPEATFLVILTRSFAGRVSLLYAGPLKSIGSW